MKKMLAAVLVGLSVASAAWAASPTSVDVAVKNGLLVIRLRGTTTGAAGEDTTYVDISKADWGTVGSGAANQYGLDFTCFNNSTAGDSVTVVFGSAFDYNNTGAVTGAVTLSNINGQDDAAASAPLTQICPLLYVTVKDVDVTKSTVAYDVYLYTKAK